MDCGIGLRANPFAWQMAELTEEQANAVRTEAGKKPPRASGRKRQAPAETNAEAEEEEEVEEDDSVRLRTTAPTP